MRCLVTGGAGFLGSHIVDRLLKEGWQVRVIDNLSTGRLENLQHKSIEVIVGDLKNMSDCMKATENIDVIFHYAADPRVEISSANPRLHFDNNILATFNILEAMRKNDVENIVFASSSSVYGEPERTPVSEDAPLKPISVYGASKVACEALIHAYSSLYGIKAVCLRYANIVGPRMKHGVVYDFIMKLKKKPHILEILGDGNQVRSFLHVEDAVEATLLAFKKAPNYFNIYNVGNIDYITIREVAEIVVEELGLKKVKFKFKGVSWSGDIKRIILDISKIMSLGWKPKLNSKEAVRKSVKEILNELDRI